MKRVAMLVAVTVGLASAAEAKCLWDCPEFRLGVETTITLTDGDISRERRLFGTATIPLDMLLNGGRTGIVLGLSEPISFPHPLLGNEKISALVGLTYSPSAHFTAATAIAILPLRDLDDLSSRDGKQYRLYVPIPRTRWLPDPFFETDGRSFGGGLSIGFNERGSRVTAEFNLHRSIPEPAAWAMMIAGFGLVGAVLRRRRIGDVARPA